MANHPETVERFLQEARLISRIRNTNLIDIFDIGELPDKRLYYVMEFLSGRTLAQVLLDQRLPFAGIVSIMTQICSGLQAAHAAGLVHRDLKPDNLFLVERKDEPPLLKIVDFGVAKVMDLGNTDAKLTRTGHLVGTPQYMSPEQINGVAIDQRSDIYALGVILYEMCTGTPPFRGETLGQMLIAHLQQIMPSIDRKLLSPDVPIEIEPIIRAKPSPKIPPSATPRWLSSARIWIAWRRGGSARWPSIGYKAYQPREVTAIQTLHGTMLTLQSAPAVELAPPDVAGVTMVPGLLLCLVGGYFSSSTAAAGGRAATSQAGPPAAQARRDRHAGAALVRTDRAAGPERARCSAATFWPRPWRRAATRAIAHCLRDGWATTILRCRRRPRRRWDLERL